jgi:hypothetical protein
MGSVRKLKVLSHQILHFILGFVKLNQYCSVSRWRPQKVDKRMVLEYTHGLFIT